MFRPGSPAKSQAMDRYLKGQEEVGRMQTGPPKEEDVVIPKGLEERIKRMQERHRRS